MILTEEEAKTKRCQESFGDRIIGDGDIAKIDPAADPMTKGSISAMHYTSPIYCLASACMAWRWGAHMPKGYCGKAGKP
jgi:hypothetical protein